LMETRSVDFNYVFQQQAKLQHLQEER